MTETRLEGGLGRCRRGHMPGEGILPLEPPEGTRLGSTLT